MKGGEKLNSMLKRRMRTMLSLSIVMSLIFSLILPVYATESAAYAEPVHQAALDQVKEALEKTAKEKLQEARTKTIEEQRRTPIVEAMAQDKHSPDEIVRVIVTLSGPDVLSNMKGLSSNTKLSNNQQAAGLRLKILQDQQAILQLIQRNMPTVIIRHQFTETMNGFSADVRYGDIPKLKALQGVLDVQLASSIQREPLIPGDKPEMYFSAPLIGAPYAWEHGYKGEDVIVAIVDSGINYFHPAFGGDGRETLKLGGSEDLTKSGGYNARVIGGYNWADDNNDIVDRTDSQHGVHVAGTVGGYDATPSGTINGQPFSGVAPSVKFLAEKVFSNDPDRASTTSDEYIAAVEHAVANGASVINMSLGSSAGAFNPEDPFFKVMKNASDAGVVFSISAGNSNYSVGPSFPFIENPDIALVGSPSINPPSISVAASMNQASFYDMMKLNQPVGNKGIQNVPMLPASSNPHPSTLKGTYKLVPAGAGISVSDFPTEVAGNVALIERGKVAFETKIQNAIHAGAVAAIIYNNAGDNFINMGTGSATAIPAASIRQSDGETILKAIQSGTEIMVSFPLEKTDLPLAVDTMTDFSSWGYEPSLGFKPTLTAPGGSIISSIGSQAYASFDGTSMAAPHVAGAAALVIERFKKDNIPYTSGDVRTALANTAKILTDPSTGLPYPVRRQGSGRIQVDQALRTDVLVTSGEEPAVNLGAFDTKERSIQVTLKNVGANDQTFHVDGMLFTDETATRNLVYEPVEKTFDLLRLREAAGLELIPADQTITVPAKSTVTLKATVRIPESLPLDRFVEGWLVFHAEEGTDQSDLVMPVYGFYGDWNRPPVIDAHWTSADSYARYYIAYVIAGYDDGGITGLYDDWFWPLGLYLAEDGSWQYRDDYVAISPLEGARNIAIPAVTLLRNAKDLSVQVLDASGGVLRTVARSLDVRKNDFESSLARILTPWDGTISNKQASDGQYIIRLSAIPYAEQGSKETAQTVDLPVKMVSRAPQTVLEPADENRSSYTLTAHSTAGIEAIYSVMYDAQAGWSDIAVFPAVQSEKDPTRFVAHLHASDFDGFEAAPAPSDFRASFVITMTVDTAGNVTYNVVEGDLDFMLLNTTTTGSDLELAWYVSEAVKDVRFTVTWQNEAEQVESWTTMASELTGARYPTGDWRDGVILPLPYVTQEVKIEALDGTGKVLASRSIAGNELGTGALPNNDYPDQTVTFAPDKDKVTVRIPYSIQGSSSDVLTLKMYNSQGDTLYEEETSVSDPAQKQGEFNVLLDVPGSYTVRLTTTMSAPPYTDSAQKPIAQMITGEAVYTLNIDYTRLAQFAEKTLRPSANTVDIEVLHTQEVQDVTLRLIDPFDHTLMQTFEQNVHGSRTSTVTLNLQPYFGLGALDVMLDATTVNGDVYRDQDHLRIDLPGANLIVIDDPILQSLTTREDAATATWHISVGQDVYTEPTRVELYARIFDLNRQVLDAYSVDTVTLSAYQDQSFTTPLDLTRVPDKGSLELYLTLYGEGLNVPLDRKVVTFRRSLSVPLPTVLAPEPFETFNAETGRHVSYLAYLPRELANFIDPRQQDALRLSIRSDDGWKDVSDKLYWMDYPEYVPGLGYLTLIFAEDIALEKEGYQNIRLEITDMAGNSAQHNRKIYADMTPPEIDLGRNPGPVLNEGESTAAHRVYDLAWPTNQPSIKLSGTVQDQLTSFVFSVNGDVLLPYMPYREGEVDRRSFSQTIDVPLGESEVILEAIDGVENKTTLRIHVNRKDAPDSGGVLPGPIRPIPVIPAPGPSPLPDEGKSEQPPKKDDTPKPEERKTVQAGEVTITRTDKTVVYTLKVTSEAFEKALKAAEQAQSHTVTLDLSDLGMKTGDSLTVILTPEQVSKLKEKGYDLALKTDALVLTIPAGALNSFTNADGSVTVSITLTAGDAGSARIAALNGIHFVSPVITVKGTRSSLDVPVKIAIKVTPANVDTRKIAVYMESSANTWRYIGGRYDAERQTITTELATLQPVAALVYEKTFADIRGHWAQAMIEVDAAHQLIQGRSETIFAPNERVTRAEFAAMLLNALGMKPENGALPFKDVDPKAWYAGVIATAYARGIAQGYDGTFRPDAPITREEMAVMFTQALALGKDKEPAVPTFKDAASIAQWAQSAVAWLESNGYISGKGDHRFAPKDHTTRAEAATMLYQWLMRK